jgi:hypothetical protein
MDCVRFRSRLEEWKSHALLDILCRHQRHFGTIRWQIGLSQIVLRATVRLQVLLVFRGSCAALLELTNSPR